MSSIILTKDDLMANDLQEFFSTLNSTNKELGQKILHSHERLFKDKL
jgi:hypothetical protein